MQAAPSSCTLPMLQGREKASGNGRPAAAGDCMLLACLCSFAAATQELLQQWVPCLQMYGPSLPVHLACAWLHGVGMTPTVRGFTSSCLASGKGGPTGLRVDPSPGHSSQTGGKVCAWKGVEVPLPHVQSCSVPRARSPCPSTLPKILSLHCQT